MLQTTWHLTTWFSQTFESLSWNPPDAPNCSVQERIRSMETYKNLMKVRLEPGVGTSGYVYEFSTRNPLFQSQLLVAHLGNQEVVIKGKAPVILARGYPVNGVTIISFGILGAPSCHAN